VPPHATHTFCPCCHTPPNSANSRCDSTNSISGSDGPRLALIFTIKSSTRLHVRPEVSTRLLHTFNRSGIPSHPYIYSHTLPHACTVPSESYPLPIGSHVLHALHFSQRVLPAPPVHHAHTQNLDPLSIRFNPTDLNPGQSTKPTSPTNSAQTRSSEFQPSSIQWVSQPESAQCSLQAQLKKVSPTQLSTWFSRTDHPGRPANRGSKSGFTQVQPGPSLLGPLSNRSPARQPRVTG
jgi:hypothetical protein